MQVLILRLQCQDSIEEKIWQISEDKRMIADKSVVGGLFDRKTDEATRYPVASRYLNLNSQPACSQTS